MLPADADAEAEVEEQTLLSADMFLHHFTPGDLSGFFEMMPG